MSHSLLWSTVAQMLILCGAALCLSACASGQPSSDTATATAPAGTQYESKTAFDGGQILYDPAGSFYHYRCADGIAMLTLWVPPSAEPVRGLFVNGNPGGISGDNRRFTRDATFRAFGARLGFGLMGLHSMPGGQVREKYAATILAVLKDFAAMGHHPELANVPLITLGNSNGASTSWAITNVAPERMVCFAMNVGGLPGEAVEGALQVPGFIVVGPKDELMGRRPNYLPQYRQTMAEARQRGALWSYLEEQNKGHEVGRIFDYEMVFFEHCIAARLPRLDEPGGDPRKGPVALKELSVDSGWLADNTQWDSGLTPIAPYAQYQGDKSTASWLPDQDLAYLYRGLATYSSPVTLRLANLGPIINENASGRFLTEVGGHLVAPDADLVLEADVSAIPEWTRLGFYEGSRKLADATPANAKDGKVSFVTRPGNETAARSYTVLAYRADGAIRTAIPVHVTVQQPGLDTSLPAKELTARPQPARPALGSAAASSAAAPQPAAPPNSLSAWALTADQEASFQPADGTVSGFWAEIPVGADLTPDNATHDPKQFSGSEDARLIVKAAHSRAGLYLYFEAIDDEWATPTPDEHMVGQDSVDFLIDSRSVDAIWTDPANSFVNAGWSLSMTTRQFQSPFGAATEPTHVRDSYVDPFEWRAYVWARTQLASLRGIVIKHATLSPNRKVQEWFLPWAEVGPEGKALTAEPQVGTSLGFSVGYNDLDPSKASADRQLRWGNTSPWRAAPYDGRAGQWARNDTWGQIVIAPQAAK